MTDREIFETDGVEGKERYERVTDTDLNFLYK